MKSSPPRRAMRAAALGTFAAVIGLFGATGVTSATTAEAASSTTPQAGGNLTIGFDLNVQNCLDPNQAFGLEQRDLDRNVVDSLTDQDPKTGKIIPWLATSWSANANGSVYTFHLRHGVTFSDGTPFNAAAVKTAYDAIDQLGPLSILGVTYMAGYKATTVINPYTVQVSFDGPNAQFLQATATTVLGILSPSSYANTPADRCLGKFTGSGPFTLTSYTPGQTAVLTKRAGYAWPSAIEGNKGAAYLNTITASWITQDSVLVGSLSSGQLDLAWPRTPLSSANQELITAAGGTIFSRPYPGISYLLLPNVTPGRVLADPVVRQALQESINRAQIASTIYWPKYPVVTSPIESTTPDSANESSLFPYQPTAAEAQLTKDGWVVGSGGFRYKAGKELTLVYPITFPSPDTDLLQAQLKTVGINLQQQLVTTAQDTSIVDDPGGNYDLTGSYLTRGDPQVLASIIDTGLVKNADAQQSQTKAVGAQVSALFAQGAAAVNPKTRAGVFAKLQALLVKDNVTYPFEERLEVTGVASKVHGLAVTDEGLLIANNIWLSS